MIPLLLLTSVNLLGSNADVTASPLDCVHQQAPCYLLISEVTQRTFIARGIGAFPEPSSHHSALLSSSSAHNQGYVWKNTFSCWFHVIIWPSRPSRAQDALAQPSQPHRCRQPLGTSPAAKVTPCR